jgi:hypothetical protein
MEWPTRECGNVASVLACNFRPPCTNSFKILKKFVVKMYTRLWVRAKIFCYDRNGASSKKLHCYRKNEIIKIKILMVTKK